MSHIIISASIHIPPSKLVAKNPKEERVRLPTPVLCSRNMVTINSHICRKFKHICTPLTTDAANTLFYFVSFRQV